jgi:hypothetical protein
VTGQTEEPQAEPESGAHLMVLLDPAFEAADEGEQDAPADAVLGGWRVDEDGNRGRFQPNPGYRPRSPDSPLDPVDALLRAISDGHDVGASFSATLRDAALGVAVDERGSALVRPAPDGAPSVLVTTAFGHRAHLGDDVRWLDVSVEELAAVLPRQGVDVLLNPGSTASMRVLADAVRAAASDDGDDGSAPDTAN